MNRNHLPRYLGHLGASACLLALTACGGSVLEGKKIDYKSAGKVQSLDVPPDLTSPARDERYVVPDVASKGSATFSNYAADQGKPTNAQATGVLPATTKARIVRSGDERWLEVDQTPEQVWPVVKQFWADSGFKIAIERPEAGVLETDWAENRAKLPQGVVRNTIGKVLEGLYDSGERDKFRTRLEPGSKPGTTDVFISHKGMEEAYAGRENERVIWRPRATDTGLEAEMLRRVMVRLAGPEGQTAPETVQEVKPIERARLVNDGDRRLVVVEDGFERAWRRVGLALDRTGFTVEDRDRAKGIYYVRYVDPDPESKPGFFARMFSSAKTKEPQTQYQVKVQDANGGSSVTVLSKDGAAESTPTTARILALLHEQLK